MNTKLITTSDIESIVMRIGLDELLDQLIERLHMGFLTFDPSKAITPVRTGIHYNNPELGLLEWMPAAIDEGKATLKIVGYHPTNPDKSNLPTILSTLCVFDTNTGHLKAIMDGTFATAIRTGAMSAVATRAMASPPEKICLGIVGCGAQAVTQCHALSRIYSIEKILAYDIEPEHAETFVSRISFIDTRVEIVDRSQLGSLLEESDVLCTCTSESPGKGPLFPDFRNRRKLHINAVGSDFPGKFELPVELLRRSFVCPDFRDQALKEGECQQLRPDEVTLDLSGLLCSRESKARIRNGPTVFDSTGHAFADYLTALLILDHADSMSLGSNIELECASPDPQDPYSFLNKSLVTSRTETATV